MLSQANHALHRRDQLGRVVAHAVPEHQCDVPNLGWVGRGIAADHDEIRQLSRSDAPEPIIGAEDLGPIRGENLDCLDLSASGLPGVAILPILGHTSIGHVMITRATLLALGAMLGLAPGSFAQQPARTRGGAPPARFADPDRLAKLSGAFPEIDRLMNGFAERSHVPGIAYGILVDGKLVHRGTVGYREVASHAPVDSATVFRIASMTKSFTALAILQLRDAGRLSLDDPAERYVPELTALTYPTTDSPKLTIRLLLSGIEVRARRREARSGWIR